MDDSYRLLIRISQKNQHCTTATLFRPGLTKGKYSIKLYQPASNSFFKYRLAILRAQPSAMDNPYTTISQQNDPIQKYDERPMRLISIEPVQIKLILDRPIATTQLFQGIALQTGTDKRPFIPLRCQLPATGKQMILSSR